MMMSNVSFIFRLCGFGRLGLLLRYVSDSLDHVSLFLVVVLFYICDMDCKDTLHY